MTLSSPKEYSQVRHSPTYTYIKNALPFRASSCQKHRDPLDLPIPTLSHMHPYQYLLTWRFLRLLYQVYTPSFKYQSDWKSCYTCLNLNQSSTRLTVWIGQAFVWTSFVITCFINSSFMFAFFRLKFEFLANLLTELMN